jgi:hypothetical protein
MVIYLSRRINMSLTYEKICQVNIFDFLCCPLCGGEKFTSLDGASVWCDYCNCRFFTRHTGGDSGVVVDCHVKWASLPQWYCKKCDLKYATMKNEGDCPKCDKWGIQQDRLFCSVWEFRELEDDNYWTTVCKTGDYYGMWSGIRDGNPMKKDAPFDRTQEQWDAFCKREIYDQRPTKVPDHEVRAYHIEIDLCQADIDLLNSVCEYTSKEEPMFIHWLGGDRKYFDEKINPLKSWELKRELTRARLHHYKFAKIDVENLLED